MTSYRVDTTLDKDGTLTLTGLPYQAGDEVEIIIIPRATIDRSAESHPLRGKVIHYDNPTDPISPKG